MRNSLHQGIPKDQLWELVDSDLLTNDRKKNKKRIKT